MQPIKAFSGDGLDMSPAEVLPNGCGSSRFGETGNGRKLPRNIGTDLCEVDRGGGAVGKMQWLSKRLHWIGLFGVRLHKTAKTGEALIGVRVFRCRPVGSGPTVRPVLGHS